MKKIHAPDYPFIITTAILLLFGFIILSSASSVIGFERFGDTFFYLKKQLIFGLVPGIILMLILSKIDYHLWRKYSHWLMLASVGLLAAVFIPGIGAEFGGSKSWLIIGSISVQPAEVVKLTFLLYLAAWLERRSAGIKQVSYGLIPFTVILGLIALLVILQPDVGTVSIIIIMSLAVYFAAGAPWSHLLAMTAGLVAGLYGLIKIAPYRAARLAVFFDPALDTQGIGYHLKQSLLAIGSGGIFGLGLGHSRQKFAYLPEAAGDSIFAIAAEELGFLLTVALIVLFVYFIMRGLRIARYAPDLYGRLVATGIITWLGWQAIVNIGAMLGLLPITGIPLPFISYGGTALTIILASVGILINISKQTGHRVPVSSKSSFRRFNK